MFLSNDKTNAISITYGFFLTVLEIESSRHTFEIDTRPLVLLEQF